VCVADPRAIGASSNIVVITLVLMGRGMSQRSLSEGYVYFFFFLAVCIFNVSILS
jgi:hypothetical protein